MISKHEIREKVAGHIDRLLMGPIDGENEIVLAHMRLRYMLGVLFGAGMKQSDLASENADLGDDADPEDQDTGNKDEFAPEQDNPLSLANEDLPSSVGISFLVTKGASIEVTCSAAQYVEEKKREWKRQPLEEEVVTVKAGDERLKPLFEENAILSCIWRKVKDGHLVTVSLRNTLEGVEAREGGGRKIDWSKNLYQVAMTCAVVKGKLLPYGFRDPSKLNMEEQIQELQFMDTPPYAVGHGSSCNWDREKNSVSVDYIPRERVYRPTYDNLIIGSEADEMAFDNEDVFSLSFLANGDNYPDGVPSSLHELCDFYQDWIDTFETSTLPEGYDGARDKLVERASHALDRMRSSVDLIENNAIARESFRLANEAMLRQMSQGTLSDMKRKDREDSGLPWPIPYDEENDPDTSNVPRDEFKWRPFQLAFCLLVISSLEDDNGDEDGSRDLVDLIWFTTGGGKTEAYLLVAAYEMIRRRLTWGDKGFGTSIITRYTYRFLTADQFSRTAKLICALDLLRREFPDLGDEPFSLGLWVGAGVTPNKLNDQSTNNKNAFDLYQQMINSSEPRKDGARFQITECPHCSAALIPESSSPEEAFGIHVNETSMQVACPNEACPFHESLPLSMVDEQMYKSPPTFIVATIDKFANLVLMQEAGAFLGTGTDRCPPSLIIQDELHLISGPLGTIAALYEAGLDETIRHNFNRLGLTGRKVKYIASTATIHNADTQVRRLFGRDVSLFPPRGVKATDSFFTREERKPETSRLYMGVMAQGLRSTSAAYWVSAAILEAVDLVRHVELGSDKAEIDFLWTLLCYCNSKRELGLINKAVNGEITERLGVYREASLSTCEEPPRSENALTKCEVSADAVKNVDEVRRDLSLRGSLDFVPCTNMVSVGIDINRLGLMMVNGQPKGTSEYIQATSRVGRRPEDIGPGLVITLYSPSKPRDRSHYEQFKSYHSSLYRMVEPTSVTPGSKAATIRALHAALICVIRFSSGLVEEGQASAFRTANHLEKVEELKLRLLQCYEGDDSAQWEKEQIKKSMDACVENWNRWAKQFPNLRYRSYSRQDKALTNPRDGIGWPTMTSMRSVDQVIKIDLKP